MESLQKKQWIKTMEIKLKTLKENNTQILTKKELNIKPISTRWVYKIKKNDDKSLTFKVRFVIR